MSVEKKRTLQPKGVIGKAEKKNSLISAVDMFYCSVVFCEDLMNDIDMGMRNENAGYNISTCTLFFCNCPNLSIEISGKPQ